MAKKKTTEPTEEVAVEVQDVNTVEAVENEATTEVVETVEEPVNEPIVEESKDSADEIINETETLQDLDDVITEVKEVINEAEKLQNLDDVINDKPMVVEPSEIQSTIDKIETLEKKLEADIKKKSKTVRVSAALRNYYLNNTFDGWNN